MYQFLYICTQYGDLSATTGFMSSSCDNHLARKVFVIYVYYKFLRHSISEWNNPNYIESILNPVLMYLNIFSYSCYLQKWIKHYNNTPVWIINSYNVAMCKGHITFAIYTPLMMTQDQAESTCLIISYGSFINQFLPDTIKSIWQLERTYTNICRQNMSTLFKEKYMNEETLPKYTHKHSHICVYVKYIYASMCVNIHVYCVWICVNINVCVYIYLFI